MVSQSLRWRTLTHRSERRRVAQLVRRTLRRLGTVPGQMQSVRLHGGERVSNLTPTSCSPVEAEATYSVAHPLGGYLEAHSFLPRFLYELSDVVLDPREGLLYTRNGALIEESSSWPVQSVRDSWPAAPSPLAKRRLPGMAIPLPSHSYYHWLIEDLPIALAAYHSFGGSVPVVVDSLSHHFVLEFLRDTGMPYIVVDGPVVMERVAFVGRGADTGWPHPSDVEKLRKLVALPGAEDKGPRDSLHTASVYVSRTRSRRSSDFEFELESRLESQGFKIVYAEELSLRDQIRLFAGTSIMVGLHGAGLSNMAFLPGRSRVVELISVNRIVPCYARLASVCQHHYQSVMYSPDESGAEVISRVCAAIAKTQPASP